jgi:AAA15 family ATPase/GTPase
VSLGNISILVGRNNSGKSAFIHALYQMQQGSPDPAGYLRRGETAWAVTLRAKDAQPSPFGSGITDSEFDISFGYNNAVESSRGAVQINRNHHTNQIRADEPHAYIYPVLAKRKVSVFQRSTDRTTATTVRSDWTYLPARLSRLANPDFPGSDEYRKACREILGFVVTSFPSENGIQAGIYLDPNTTVELEAMGEGVSAVAGILADLASARGKLFLIEEPENDLHPAALKAILELILISSKSNQFVISTHSSIVLRVLGSADDAVILQVKVDTELPPTSTYEELPPSRACSSTLHPMVRASSWRSASDDRC